MIAVTGGAGFIGSNLLKKLQQMVPDDPLIVVDNITDENIQNISDVQISNWYHPQEFFSKFESKIRLVYHLGAITDTTYKDTTILMQNNFTYSKNLLELCIRHKVDLVYASSAAVYGKGNNGFREEPECESPLNVYGFSKLAFDNYVRNIAFDSGLRKSDIIATGLRYFNVYGPGEQAKGGMASPAYKFTQEALREGTITLFNGSEKYLRDFISVDDIVDANFYFSHQCGYAWDRKDGGKAIYNVGSGNPLSFKEIADIVSEETNATIKYIHMPKNLKGRYQKYTNADLTNLRAAGYNNLMKDPTNSIRQYVKYLIAQCPQK